MRNRLGTIKGTLADYQGCMVRLHAIGERNKILDTFGILEGVYPEVFVVRVQQDSYCKRYCYAYREILTNRVHVSPAFSLG